MQLNIWDKIFLENDAVLLRPLEMGDVEYLHHFVTDEPEIWTYTLSQIQTLEDFQKYIQAALDAKLQKREYAFIVYDKVKKKYAGCTQYYDIQLAYKTLQIGFTWYGKEFQGTKLNKNCKLLLLEYAFETLGMERVEFRADNRNQRSKRAMQSIGCTVEGVLRNHLPTKEGGRRDSIILSILKQEWYDTVKRNIVQKIEEQ